MAHKFKKRDKICIIGTIGSGKSYLAKKLSQEFKIKHYCLDNIYWAKKYSKKRNIESRIKELKKVVKNKKWIIEGVFFSWTEDVFKKADIVIWLDLEHKFLRRNLLKRYFKKKFKGELREDEGLLRTLKLIKFVKGYRGGDRKNTYQNHKKMIEKHKVENVLINNSSQLKDFLKDFLEK